MGLDPRVDPVRVLSSNPVLPCRPSKLRCPGISKWFLEETDDDPSLAIRVFMVVAEDFLRMEYSF